MIQEFKPALIFLVKFIGLYFFANLLYGLFVEVYDNIADPITETVTYQTAVLLQVCGIDAYHEFNPKRPTVFLKQSGDVIVSVFEGCNGVNVIIVFCAFIFAFGGPPKKMMWFVPAGIAIIHGCNLVRISLLYLTSIYSPRYFYYFHKYFFTAILYIVVFILWTIWVIKFNMKNKTSRL